MGPATAGHKSKSHVKKAPWPLKETQKALQADTWTLALPHVSTPAWYFVNLPVLCDTKTEVESLTVCHP